MAILVTGLSHKTAPVEVRERVSIGSAGLSDAFAVLRSCGFSQSVILSTCNRTEVYTLSSDPAEGVKAIQHFFAAFCNLSSPLLEPYLYTYVDDDAVRHLLRVACGLDSMILGEDQILGQVRTAFAFTAGRGMTGPVLSRLFHEALRVGKAARHSTAIGRAALSVSRATVQLAKRTMEDLRFAHVLLLGAGEAAKLAGRAMAEAGVAQIVVANRTLQRAIELAAELGALAAPLEDLEGLVGEADIIIGATGSPGYILTPELVARANRDPSRSLLAIDIAVPQDIDPRIKAMPGVALFDIDDLELIAEVNRRSRQQAACQVEALVTAEVQRFAEWLSSREMTPTVAAIQERAESIRKRELARLLKVSRQLTSEEQERVEAFSRAMLKKLLHPAMASLKGRRDPSYAQAARGLFGLDDAEGSRE